MNNKRLTAVALGTALAFLVVAYFYWGSNDMSYAFAPATRATEPYGPEGQFFYYPIWALYFLKGMLLLGVEWAAIGAGLMCIVAAWLCSEKWDTPPWITLIAPPLLLGIGYTHPFEALVLAGLTLGLQGHVGIALCLLMFKPSIGFMPGLYLALRHQKGFTLPTLLVVGSTAVDFALTGRLWLIPFCETIKNTPGLAWNASLWPFFGWLSLLWLPIGLWILFSQRSEKRRLFIAYALGLLLCPYWGALSSWPLVAMVGCWREPSTL
jgi:hypothetical protein